MAEPQRIAKLLARAGVASRREIERMIADRRIALDGVALETPATIVTSLNGVTVDGQPVAAPEAARLFRFHKPAGFLTAERDMKGRATIYDRLPADMPRTVPVGRLDLNTEGLLLMTTDGGLKRRLELPATGVPRSYRARAYGQVSQSQLEELIHGIEIDGVRYGQIDANLERRTGANVWIEMTLKEGKNREVRRVLEHLGLTVSRLIRTRYGPFALGDMPVGAVEEVKQHELVEFLKSLGDAPLPTQYQSGEPALRKQWRIKPKRETVANPPKSNQTRHPREGGGPTPEPRSTPRFRELDSRLRGNDDVRVKQGGHRAEAPKPRAPAAETSAPTRPKKPKPKAGWAKAKPKTSKGPRRK